MTKNILLEKSYNFALATSKVVLQIQKNKKEFVLTKQLIRSATSVGACIEEAQGCESRKDFLHKLSIAYKESLETKYWLRLLRDLDLIDHEKGNILISECEELVKIIAKSRITIRKNLKKSK